MYFTSVFSCILIPVVAPNFMLALQVVSQRISKTNPGTILKADHENKKGEIFKYGTMSTSVPPPRSIMQNIHPVPSSQAAHQ